MEFGICVMWLKHEQKDVNCKETFTSFCYLFKYEKRNFSICANWDVTVYVCVNGSVCIDRIVYRRDDISQVSVKN